MKHILILGHIDRSGRDLLKDDGRFSMHCLPDHDPERFRAAGEADATIVRMTAIDEELLRHAPRLQFVSRHGVGHDTVDKAVLSARGIPLSITGDVNSGAVAEHAMALMLAAAKRVVDYDRAVKSGDFSIRDSFSSSELEGKTLLLVGYGRIGRKVAHLAAAFGMRVSVFDPFLDEPPGGATAFVDLHDGLRNADYITLHAPKTPETTHIIDASALAVMKPEAVLVNVARGGLVDETALAGALNGERLRAAALDVFEDEPPVMETPLMRGKNLTVTPHSAAFTAECAARMSTASAQNVIDFFDGRLDEALIVNKDVLVQREGGAT